jgi:hypothetical protein
MCLTFHNVVDLAQREMLMPLPTMMKKARRFRCTDVRDRLYGTLGLIDWSCGPPSAYTVDYNVTSLDLLLRIIKDLTLQPWRIGNAMSMFEHTLASTQMQGLVACARQGTIIPNSVVIAGLTASFGTQHLENLPRDLCQVHESPYG